MKVLVVEDDRITRLSLADALEREGYQVRVAADGPTGLTSLQQDRFDVVITDLRLPGCSGLEILKMAKAEDPGCDVLIITAHAAVETAVEALKLGAYDYVTKPLSPDKFLSMLRNIHQVRRMRDENAWLHRRLEISENRAMVGDSPMMRGLLETVLQVAQHDYTVLLQGESGTGKEMVARTLHFNSPRKDKPFVAVNCAAIPESLLESELFGHEKGAFSGAVQRHRGYFERAHRGTLFIDDIDDLPLGPQVKLLRVLQERNFHRLGGRELVEVDVRVVCATKVDLQQHVAQKLFRDDLFYRLNIVPLVIPALRDRRGDIPALVRHFFEKHGADEMVHRIEARLFEQLSVHDWPGNVRELENLVQRMIATGDASLLPGRQIGHGTGVSLTPGHFPESTGAVEAAATAATTASSTTHLADDSASDAYPSFDAYMREKEREILTWALHRADQNVSQAARLLDLPRGTLRSRLEKLGIASPSG
jgi:two-component system, NtrC family, response regulator AtoC